MSEYKKNTLNLFIFQLKFENSFHGFTSEMIEIELLKFIR